VTLYWTLFTTLITRESPFLTSKDGPGNCPFTVIVLWVLHSLFTGVVWTYISQKKEEEFITKYIPFGNNNDCNKFMKWRKDVQQIHGTEFRQLQKKKGKHSWPIGQLISKSTMAWQWGCKSPLLSQPMSNKACKASVSYDHKREQLFILSKSGKLDETTRFLFWKRNGLAN
jgi:hypothetical protein